eukprot:jgi/Mesvir1/17976/Mv09868-RA.1
MATAWRAVAFAVVLLCGVVGVSAQACPDRTTCQQWEQELFDAVLAVISDDALFACGTAFDQFTRCPKDTGTLANKCACYTEQLSIFNSLTLAGGTKGTYDDQLARLSGCPATYLAGCSPDSAQYIQGYAQCNLTAAWDSIVQRITANPLTNCTCGNRCLPPPPPQLAAPPPPPVCPNQTTCQAWETKLADDVLGAISDDGFTACGRAFDQITRCPKDTGSLANKCACYREQIIMFNTLSDNGKGTYDDQLVQLAGCNTTFLAGCSLDSPQYLQGYAHAGIANAAMAFGLTVAAMVSLLLVL